jgi:hypothetical protein
LAENQKGMLPSFEIYLSILSDSWMPWLPDNRREEKFESLLFALQPASEIRFQRFFRHLIPALRNTSSTVSTGFINEIKVLAKLKDSGKHLSFAPVFMQLSARQPRELFYHALASFALDGYRQWLEAVLPEKEGEISAYIMTRTIDRLHSVLQLPAMKELAEQRELRLLYLVKVALACLFTHLMNRNGRLYRGLASAFRAPEAVKAEINRSRLPEPEKNELLHLLDQLLTANSNQPVIPVTEKKPSTGIENEGNKRAPKSEETYELRQLVKEWQTDVADIKDVFGQLAAKPEEKEKKTLDSATVMKMLNISKSTLHRYRKKGIITCSKLGGKYLYPEPEILKLIKNENGNTGS